MVDVERAKVQVAGGGVTGMECGVMTVAEAVVDVIIEGVEVRV